MSDYKYLVFPSAKQPTVDEMAEFRDSAYVLEGRFAIGICRKTSNLVFAFAASQYENALALRHDFANLIEKWTMRGCVVVDRLAFVKDSAALRPMQPKSWLAVDNRAHCRESLSSKDLAAKEAIARSRLGVSRTLDRYDALRRFAVWVPYLLIALGALMTIAAGFYVGNRLLEGRMEKRRETTERVITSPMKQALEPQPKQPDQ
ncbi:MAG: hypothetical protein KDA57_11150 [Planctomycetales bacterium]|nr:hypothetical protein [Planctomycetales bacterium]